MKTEGTQPETMGKVIPFRPRGGALIIEDPSPVPEFEPPDRDTGGALRVILISMSIFFLFGTGVVAGWLLGTSYRPTQLLNVLQHQLRPDGIILSPQAEAFLAYPLKASPRGVGSPLTSLPLRLSAQTVLPEQARQIGLKNQESEASPFSNRLLELAILLAIEEEGDPALLEGLARLTLAHATDLEDIVLAHKALELALDKAPHDVNLLNDYAVLSLALELRDKAEYHLELASALLEDYDPRLKPILYNQALMRRGGEDPEEELEWLHRYLRVEGVDFWSIPMIARRDALSSPLRP